MFDITYGNLDFDLMLRIASIIVLLPIQLWLCFKVKKRLVRLLPVVFFFVLGIAFVCLASISTGWDSLGYIIFAIYAAYMLFVCGVGWLIWWLVNYCKNRK